MARACDCVSGLLTSIGHQAQVSNWFVNARKRVWRPLSRGELDHSSASLSSSGSGGGGWQGMTPGEGARGEGGVASMAKGRGGLNICPGGCEDCLQSCWCFGPAGNPQGETGGGTFLPRGSFQHPQVQGMQRFLHLEGSRCISASSEADMQGFVEGGFAAADRQYQAQAVPMEYGAAVEPTGSYFRRVGSAPGWTGGHGDAEVRVGQGGLRDEE